MKKIIILICLTVFITGCNIKKIDITNRDEIISIALNNNIKLYNKISSGYKYYLPKGISQLNYKDYNEILYSNLNKYYLYVDVVSYHYKKEKNYIENKSLFYSKLINNNGKKGLIQIEKIEDNYYILYEYNYAKMEAKVSEKDINETIMNMSYILSSIEYNDIVIDSIIGENILNFKEEKFNIKKPKESENTFLDYVNTYDKYEEDEKIEDNDTINQNIDNNIE